MQINMGKSFDAKAPYLPQSKQHLHVVLEDVLGKAHHRHKHTHDCVNNFGVLLLQALFRWPDLCRVRDAPTSSLKREPLWLGQDQILSFHRSQSHRLSPCDRTLTNTTRCKELWITPQQQQRKISAPLHVPAQVKFPWPVPPACLRGVGRLSKGRAHTDPDAQLPLHYL